MSKHGMTVKSQLWLLTGLLIVNVALIGGVAMWNLKQLIGQLETVGRVQVPAIVKLGEIDMYHDAIRSAVFRSLISSDPDNIELAYNEYTAYAEKIVVALEELDQLPVSQETHDAAGMAKVAIATYKKASQEIIDLAAQGQRRDAFAKVATYQLAFDELGQQLDMLRSMTDKNTAAITEAGEKLAERSALISLALALLGVVVGLVSAYFVVRAIVKSMTNVMTSLGNEVVSLTRSATQLQGASSQLAESTTEQSAAIEETAASIEEISAMISQTAQNAYGTLEETKGGQEHATVGREVVSRMVHAMGEIQESNEKLGKIVKLIEEIRNKTKVINDIAFETRLLSFNASIEAARAGAHGKGFAVVAEEVGKLASVSGKAADEIRSLLESSISEVTDIVNDTQERVGAGRDISKQCETTFTSMGESLTKIAESVNLIASAAKEQEAGVKQTNTAMTEMDKVTQRNSRSAETLANQVTHLMGASENLKETIVDLQMLLTGVEGAIETKGNKNANPPRKPGDGAGREGANQSLHASGTVTSKVEATSVAALPTQPGSVAIDSEAAAVSATKSVSRNDSRWRAA